MPRPALKMSPLPKKNLDIEPWPWTPGQLGLTVGVPFFDETVLHGDLSVDLRYGYKFWWFVPYVSGGFRQVRMDPEMVPAEAEKKKVLAWHVVLSRCLALLRTIQLESWPRHKTATWILIQTGVFLGA
jgi:hypothetical protein